MSLAAGLTLVFGLATTTQAEDSLYQDYNVFSDFVGDSVRTRDWPRLIQELGGRDEYTPEQLSGLNNQFNAIYPRGLNDGIVFNRREIGPGLWEEGRMYWTGRDYLYFYFLLHQTDDKLIVLRFNFNSNARAILDLF
ncbi:MAG: hypothetical protein N4A61_10910 [Pelagimonas sp.]|jgi:hypothetical protein|nr:hypothetical protein [Pelagimonas sp.]